MLARHRSPGRSFISGVLRRTSTVHSLADLPGFVLDGMLSHLVFPTSCLQSVLCILDLRMLTVNSRSTELCRLYATQLMSIEYSMCEYMDYEQLNQIQDKHQRSCKYAESLRPVRLLRAHSFCPSRSCDVVRHRN